MLGLFGIWSAATPFVFGYRELVTAFYSDVIVGATAFIAAVVGIYYRPHYGAVVRRPRNGFRAVVERRTSSMVRRLFCAAGTCAAIGSRFNDNR